MGPPSYIRSVVDRNLVMRRMTVFAKMFLKFDTSVAQGVRCCTTNRKVAVSIPAGVSGFFIDIKYFRSHYGPGVDSVSNRNEYQKYFLAVKGGRCVRLTTYHHPVPLLRNLGTLTSRNPLDPSGPVTGLLLLKFDCVGHGHCSTRT